MMHLLLRGMILGFSIAAPVGPIGVLCIHRTLADGRSAGLISGLGAATADATYGCIAGFGLTLISDFLVDQQGWIRFLGGLFLCYLGTRTFFTEPADQATRRQGSGLAGSYVSAFLLTLSNPMTILAFTAIFAGLGLVDTGQSYAAAVTLVLGIFIGSVVWWTVLTGVASLFRDRLNLRVLRWVNRFSGVVVTIFGVNALVTLL